MNKCSCRYSKVKGFLASFDWSNVNVPHAQYVVFFAIALTCCHAMAESVPIVFAGGQQDVVQGSTTDQPSSERNVEIFPDRLSQLDGWHGVKLAFTSQGVYTYCSYKFPDRFGARDSNERKVLLNLVRNNRKIRIDIAGCMVSFDSAYHQLFRLASEYQVAELARWFVMPRGVQALNLDGEWVETYNLTYRPRVLVKFDKLQSIIAPDEESPLVGEICDVVATSADSYPTDANLDLIVKSLRAKGMSALAQKLIENCGD